MKIAITSQSITRDSQIDPRFGRAKNFLVYDDKDDSWEAIDNKQNFEAAQGAGIQAASLVASKNCSVVITGHCGPKAFSALTAAGIAIYTCNSGTVEEAFEKFKNGELKKADNSDVEGHW
jgi:predicted Fe-Mo cluster-binding NifX family protein